MFFVVAQRYFIYLLLLKDRTRNRRNGDFLAFFLLLFFRPHKFVQINTSSPFMENKIPENTCNSKHHEISNYLDLKVPTPKKMTTNIYEIFFHSHYSRMHKNPRRKVFVPFGWKAISDI